MQKAKKTIILVRHGESSFNRDGLIQGQTDSDSLLTACGIHQAEKVADWLKGVEIERCICSPLKRVKQTTSIIADKLGINNVEEDKRLMEVDFGKWVGRLRSDIKMEYPEQYMNWRKRPFDFVLDGHFPVRDLYSRLEDIVSDLSDPLKNNGNILIVGHRGTVSGLVIKLLNLPKSHHHFLQIDRGSVTIIRERHRHDGIVDFELFCANERPVADQFSPVDFESEERTKSFGELFLVRHGQTESNIDRKFQGGKDIGLSNVGIDNVKILSESFKPKYPTRIFSSPLIRAQESARIIASAFNIKTVSLRKDLHEFLYGVWEGMLEEDVQKYRSGEYNQWKAAPTDTEIPQAEHINDAYNRCGNVWDFYEKDIKEWHGSIISIAHDIVNRLLICNALDLPASYVWKFKQTNASVSVLAVKQSYDGRLRMLNHNKYSLKMRLADEWL